MRLRNPFKKDLQQHIAATVENARHELFEARIQLAQLEGYIAAREQIVRDYADTVVPFPGVRQQRHG